MSQSALLRTVWGLVKSYMLDGNTPCNLNAVDCEPSRAQSMRLTRIASLDMMDALVRGMQSSCLLLTALGLLLLQGWSLSMVTQYDVDLVHNIEDLTGVTLDAYDMDEAAVLKGITRVFKAKRAASMRIADEKGFEGVTVSGQANKRARRR